MGVKEAHPLLQQPYPQDATTCSYMYKDGKLTVPGCVGVYSVLARGSLQRVQCLLRDQRYSCGINSTTSKENCILKSAL